RDFKPTRGAKCAGIHLEGPFLCYAKRGAQAAENLHLPDAAMFHRLNEASGGIVKMVTVACEEEGAMPFIREVSRVCAVSLGHTTADYDTAMAGFLAGATHATHLYNGMPSFLHRAPGVIGAALDAGASVELICDGLHIHPAVIRATYRMFGDKLNLISDSLRCTGMPDGGYELGGQPIVMKDHKATLLDGTLAGSSISLLKAVQNVVRFGLPLEAAVYAASTAPAQAAGLEVGVIAQGRPADLLVLDKNLELKAVFVDGKRQ
ncbi:MAG: N-acetylglucosamine-6-phosphate deacetylase, partial [Oscillospiraceae bacterium]|nr:N-acetylglucosamine-6-phosphate deacetylase [Oscillospiraceae bacterium]